MAKIVYNKLVRDRIPEIIKNSGKTSHIEIMNEKEYEKALLEKLQEEAYELFNASPGDRVKEIADVQEVLLAILNHWEIDLKTVSIKREKRAVERGSFNKRIKLLWVEE